MKILHYSLGFPPYRTGGMTKFCMDLMREQVKEGHEVSLLWPGEIKLISHKTDIRKGKAVDGISNYEVINPLPVPFDEGIKSFKEFTEEGDSNVYFRFLKKITPDVIHIHTLMGLHKSFLVVAKENGIRLVFTTHDFFPICPKVTMFRHGQICSSIESCEECGVCNNTALSLRKIQILQSPIYRKNKDAEFIKKLRKRHRDEYLGDNNKECEKSSFEKELDYKALRKFYKSFLLMMDVVHYNSTIAKNVYESKLGVFPCKVISITHANISNNLSKRYYSSDVLRIRYLGPQSAAKGYYSMIDVLDHLYSHGIRIKLDIHFKPTEMREYIVPHARYDYSELKEIFDATDILICPSIWYETFGYTVLESISYAVPVIISDTVGAKDIIPDGGGLIYTNKEELSNSIKTIDNETLRKMNRKIIEKAEPISMRTFACRMMELYTNSESGEV